MGVIHCDICRFGIWISITDLKDSIVNVHELGLQVPKYDRVLLLREFGIGKQCEVEVSGDVWRGALECANTIAIEGDAVEAMILPLGADERDAGPIEGDDSVGRRILCEMKGASGVGLCIRV